jgi:hypothetical protein
MDKITVSDFLELMPLKKGRTFTRKVKIGWASYVKTDPSPLKSGARIISADG